MMDEREIPLSDQGCVCVACGMEVPLRRNQYCMDLRCPACGAGLSGKTPIMEEPRPKTPRHP